MQWPDSRKKEAGEKLSDGKKAQPFYKKVPLYGMLVALAMVLSYVEAQIPVFYYVPGMKLGLTNLVIIMALYRFGEKDAFLLNMLRIVLVSITFSNVYSLWYSLAGGILSFIVMVLLKKTQKFSVTGVSVAGAVAHNFGQILVAVVVLSNSMLLYYFPVLLISGTVSGFLIGLLGAKLMKHINYGG